jgi:hypothetical protein
MFPSSGITTSHIEQARLQIMPYLIEDHHCGALDLANHQYVLSYVAPLGTTLDHVSYTWSHGCWRDERYHSHASVTVLVDLCHQGSSITACVCLVFLILLEVLSFLFWQNNMVRCLMGAGMVTIQVINTIYLFSATGDARKM